jgi:para-aminobenzoate synthetase component 1
VVGYLAYDLGRFIEQVPHSKSPQYDELVLNQYDACVTFDMSLGRAWLSASSTAAADALINILERSAPPLDADALISGVPRFPVSEAVYVSQVRQVQELIAQGDVYQVNLSHRATATLGNETSAAALYRQLREVHPAPFGAFFDAGQIALLSNSPEAFLKVDLRPDAPSVTTWPLKGTRPRASDPSELAHDPKERAEHVMIVDLERNDLGRIAVPGSVQVPDLMHIVSHSTVHHIESRVTATPRADVDLVDLILATFPGGSITGAPKIRAMEIIADMESESRGPYCGAMGYVDYGGMQSLWSIPIRTAVVDGRDFSFRVGGGIVANSEPSAEYEETLVKARAFLDVLGPSA